MDTPAAHSGALGVPHVFLAVRRICNTLQHSGASPGPFCNTLQHFYHRATFAMPYCILAPWVANLQYRTALQAPQRALGPRAPAAWAQRKERKSKGKGVEKGTSKDISFTGAPLVSFFQDGGSLDPGPGPKTRPPECRPRPRALGSGPRT